MKNVHMKRRVATCVLFIILMGCNGNPPDEQGQQLSATAPDSKGNPSSEQQELVDSNAPSQERDPDPDDHPRDVISRPRGADHIVTTVKIPIADGLFLSIIFLVLDQTSDDVAPLGGLSGIVMLDNATSSKNYNLGTTTKFAILRNGQRFVFDQPKVEQLNKVTRSLTYSVYSPQQLYEFLEESGPTGVELNGTAYQLPVAWKGHIRKLVKEVENQLQLKKSAAITRPSDVGARPQSEFQHYLDVVAEVMAKASGEDVRAYASSKFAYDRDPTPENGQAMRRAVEHAVVNTTAELRRKYEEAKTVWLSASNKPHVAADASRPSLPAPDWSSISTLDPFKLKRGDFGSFMNHNRVRIVNVIDDSNAVAEFYSIPDVPLEDEDVQRVRLWLESEWERARQKGELYATIQKRLNRVDVAESRREVGRDFRTDPSETLVFVPGLFWQVVGQKEITLADGAKETLLHVRQIAPPRR